MLINCSWFRVSVKDADDAIHLKRTETRCDNRLRNIGVRDVIMYGE